MPQLASPGKARRLEDTLMREGFQSCVNRPGGTQPKKGKNNGNKMRTIGVSLETADKRDECCCQHKSFGSCFGALCVAEDMEVL